MSDTDFDVLDVDEPTQAKTKKVQLLESKLVRALEAYNNVLQNVDDAITMISQKNPDFDIIDVNVFIGVLLAKMDLIVSRTTRILDSFKSKTKNYHDCLKICNDILVLRSKAIESVKIMNDFFRDSVTITFI